MCIVALKNHRDLQINMMHSLVSLEISKKESYSGNVRMVERLGGNVVYWCDR